MENGISLGGSGARHDSPSSPHDRRKTVSGAIPQLDYEDDNDQVIPIETMRFPWSSPSAPTVPVPPTTAAPSATTKSPGHKRTFSGNFFAKVGFLRGSNDDGRPLSRSGRPSSRDKDLQIPAMNSFTRKSTDDDAPLASPTSPTADKENALAAVLKQSKTRKRKGSLRKTALLGGRRVGTDSRERKGSIGLAQRNPSTKQVQLQIPQASESLTVNSAGMKHDGDATHIATDDDSAQPLKRQFSYEVPPAVGGGGDDGDWSAVSARRLSLLNEQKAQAPIDPTSLAAINRPGRSLETVSPPSYASTTDDDDLLTFGAKSKLLPLPQTAPSSATTSSFNDPISAAGLTPHYSPSLTRHHSNKSALAPPPILPHPEPHPYSETESWGWIILGLTWLAFTIGMGSCLDLWSWAWDVGETPYAPPELEDDPTLPIVGYYPALMVLTGVVAWVWITVAWVGMKYFRHAKIEV